MIAKSTNITTQPEKYFRSTQRISFQNYNLLHNIQKFGVKLPQFASLFFTGMFFGCKSFRISLYLHQYF
jgi:hypothetical protein